MIADPAPSPTFVRWPYVFNLSTASFDPNHHSLLGHCFLAVVAVVFPTGSFLRTRTLPSSPTLAFITCRSYAARGNSSSVAPTFQRRPRRHSRRFRFPLHFLLFPQLSLFFFALLRSPSNQPSKQPFKKPSSYPTANPTSPSRFVGDYIH